MISIQSVKPNKYLHIKLSRAKDLIKSNIINQLQIRVELNWEKVHDIRVFYRSVTAICQNAFKLGTALWLPTVEVCGLRA